MSPDPILEKYLPSVSKNGTQKPGLAGGVFNSANTSLYTYSHSNPVTYSDPDGNVVVKIPFSSQLFVLQKNPSGGFRAYLTTKDKGRHIDPSPNGLLSRNKISFVNDNPSGASTDQKVSFDLADTVEGAVKESQLNININSTTGGHRTGQHPDQEAVDINRVGGKRVDDKGNIGNVTSFQKALSKQKNIFRNYGSAGQTQSNIRNGNRSDYPVPTMKKGHQNHIHASVPHEQERNNRND